MFFYQAINSVAFRLLRVSSKDNEWENHKGKEHTYSIGSETLDERQKYQEENWGRTKVRPFRIVSVHRNGTVSRFTIGGVNEWLHKQTMNSSKFKMISIYWFCGNDCFEW